MSRSYRKVAGCTIRSSWKQFAKRCANKRVRKFWNWHKIKDGRSYKRLYCNWDIQDYRYVCFDSKVKYVMDCMELNYRWGRYVGDVFTVEEAERAYRSEYRK